MIKALFWNEWHQQRITAAWLFVFLFLATLGGSVKPEIYSF